MKSLLFVLLLVSHASFGQDCQNQGKKDWVNVEIRTLEQREAPEGVHYIGEGILQKVNANSIKDLSEKQIKAIKQKTAKFRGCVVYIDFNNVMELRQGLYYVWTDEGKSPQN